MIVRKLDDRRVVLREIDDVQQKVAKEQRITPQVEVEMNDVEVAKHPCYQKEQIEQGQNPQRPPHIEVPVVVRQTPGVVKNTRNQETGQNKEQIDPDPSGIEHLCGQDKHAVVPQKDQQDRNPSQAI